jgi:hypothetical protein
MDRSECEIYRTQLRVVESKAALKSGKCASQLARMRIALASLAFENGEWRRCSATSSATDRENKTGESFEQRASDA